MDAMERWGKARQARLDEQKRGRENGQTHLADCQKQGLEVVLSTDEPCFNGRWGECEGKVEYCATLGAVVLCTFHHERLHVGKTDGGKPQPGNHYFRPAAQVRAALEDGGLILWCKCGEPFYPTRYTSNRSDGAFQEFGCPNGHRMEVVVYWEEKESDLAASVEPAAATVS